MCSSGTWRLGAAGWATFIEMMMSFSSACVSPSISTLNIVRPALPMPTPRRFTTSLTA